MSIAHALHNLSAVGRSEVLDEDLYRLACEHPDLLPVFQETQFLRQEVLDLLDRLDGAEDRISQLEG